MLSVTRKGVLLRLEPSPCRVADVDLILIRGPDSPPVRQWGVFSPHWQDCLAKTSSRIGLVVYECNVEFGESFFWSTFLGEGRVLLEQLLAGLSDTTSPRLLSFMCHGLGGYVLKQALCIANAQPERYAIVLSSILGLVFLGAPHITSDHPLLAERSLLMLRSTQTSVSKQCLLRLERDSRVLMDIAKLFEDIRLRVAILSVFETKETKIKLGLMSSKKLILVDAAIAKTNSVYEKMLGFSCGHADLCELQLAEDVLKSELEDWLEFVFGEECRSGVERKLDLLKGPPSPATSITSSSSYDAARKALAGGVHMIYTDPENTTSMEQATGSSATQEWDVIPLVSGFTPPRRHAVLPCFMMETLVPNKDFYARESIMTELDSCLLPSQHRVFSSEPELRRYAVLCGLGGLGKTSIAIHFMFSRKQNFDAIFWIRADVPSKLDQDFCKIAGKLGLEDSAEPQDRVVSRGLAKGWLENPKKVLDQNSDLLGQTEANWLLIFDNADSPDILHDYWPMSNCGSILVTSRDPHSKSVPSTMSHDIRVPLLRDEEAASMLRTISRVSKDPDASLEIAKKLSGLPLAVAQMAAVIRYQYLSFTEFLERYEDDEDRKELHAYDAGMYRQETRGNLSTIWFVDQLNPTPRTLLEICALLDPDCIQERILLTKTLKIESLDTYPNTWLTYTTARGELIKRSLISRNEDRRELWIHRMLQDSVISRMPEERIRVIYAATIQLMSDAWGPADLARRHDISLSKSRAGLFPHTLRLKLLYEKYSFLKDRKTSLQVGSLMKEAGWWQHERGNSHDSKPFFSLTEHICHEFPSDEATHLLCDAYYGLAAAANETNDADGCLRHTEKFLNMRLQMAEKTGIHDLRLAIAHNEYGIALLMKGNYEGAVAAFERSIKVYQSLEGYWPGLDTNPRTNMAFVLLAIGKLNVAYTTLHELLNDRELKFGIMDSESFRTGRVLKGLADVTMSQGRLPESEEFAKKALQQWQATIGSNHHKTADGCIAVAKHCLRHHDFDNGRKLIDQALKIYGVRANVCKPQIARAFFMKARLAMLSGSEEEGTALFKQAKDTRREIPWAIPKADAELRDKDFEEPIILFSR